MLFPYTTKKHGWNDSCRVKRRNGFTMSSWPPGGNTNAKNVNIKPLCKKSNKIKKWKLNCTTSLIFYRQLTIISGIFFFKFKTTFITFCNFPFQNYFLCCLSSIPVNILAKCSTKQAQGRCCYDILSKLKFRISYFITNKNAFTLRTFSNVEYPQIKKKR